MKQVVLVVAIIILILILLYFMAVMPRMIHRADFEPFKDRLYAHRGLYDNAGDAPENSLNAFQKAVDMGFGIELDVQLTADDILVVCHDFDLKRICGVDKKVRDLTYEELQQYHILESDQTIPKFSDVLGLIDGQVPLIIEYKMPGADTKTCRLADEMLHSYEGVYCVESFNPMAVFWYRNNRSDILRGFLSDSFVKEGYRDYPMPAYEVLHHLLLNFLIKPDFIAYDAKYYNDLSRRICRDVYKAPAVAWTIQSQQELEDRSGDFDIFIFDSFLPKQ